VPERVRVLMVVAEVSGGIAAHVKSLAEALPGLDLDVTVMGPARSLAVMALDRSSVRTVEAPVGRLGPWARWTVRRQLRGLGPGGQVVHAHGLRAAAAAGAAPRPVPLVVTWHNAARGSRARRLLQARVERWVARRADVVLAASDDLARRARQAGAQDVRTVFVVSPPRTPRIGPTRAREEIRRDLAVAPGIPLVLCIARLAPQTRPAGLVAAAAAWPATGPGARRVVIAGDGPLRTELSAQITTSGAPVTLLGSRDDIADLLAAADVAVLTSEWEARALAAQEALRAGVPLVCTAVGGLPELLGDAAVLVPVGDAPAVRSAVDRILGDAELRAALVARGRHRAEAWPTLTEEVAELRTLYLDLAVRSR
jgi:glycosyltransferase involved in cell wall biosynthesis